MECFLAGWGRRMEEETGCGKDSWVRVRMRCWSDLFRSFTDTCIRIMYL